MTTHPVQVTVSGHQMEVGHALEEHAQQRLSDLTQFFDHIIDAQVICHMERHEHVVEVTLHASGIYLHAEGTGGDWYAATDEAADKLRRQLKRYKARLKNHGERRTRMEELAAQLPVLEASHSEFEASVFENAPEDALAEFAPEVQHKELKKITPMTVDDAVMQMDLLHQNVFVFQNASTGLLNVVYRKKDDGPVIWLEPRTN